MYSVQAVFNSAVCKQMSSNLNIADVLRKTVMKYSIIMAAYNAEKYIEEAADSVLKQSYQNWELIIVDDGSTDRTGFLADTFARKDKRVKAVHQRHSGTAASARNTALLYVTGDYVQLLDADDYLDKNCLAAYEKAVTEYLEIAKVMADAVSPVSYSVNDNGKVLGEVSKASHFTGQVLTGKRAFALSLDWTIHGWIAVRRPLLVSIGFDAELINGDEFTSRKIFHHCRKILVTKGIYYYRSNPQSTTKSRKNRARMYEALITDGNLYRYALEEEMDEKIRTLCRKKWLRSMMAHQAQYNRECKEYTKDEKKFAANILKTNFEEIGSVCRAGFSDGFFGILYGLSNHSYRFYCKICSLYNFFWNIRQFIIRTMAGNKE